MAWTNTKCTVFPRIPNTIPCTGLPKLSFCLHKETRIVRKAKTGRGVGGRVDAVA